MNHAIVIAKKEMLDGVRDIRSLMAAMFYALMGPLVVGLVAVATRDRSQTGATVLTGMMAIFTLVSAFVGGMNVAMDTIAGERERRSLLPLLLNPVARSSVAFGKWLAVSFFAVIGLLLDVIGFGVVFAASGLRCPSFALTTGLGIVSGLLSLPLLAASIQLLISAISSGAKEAQTYLSLIVFLPMGLGMFLVFRPVASRAWAFLPLVGQQLQLEAWMKGGQVGLWQAIALTYVTLAVALALTLITANRLQQDEIIYGK